VNAFVGHVGVLLSVLGAVAGMVFIWIGLRQDKPDFVRRGITVSYLLVGGAILATIAMEHALITHDFSLGFVAANNARETPLFFSITGMWSALQGSILLWGLILAGYLALVGWRYYGRADDPVVAWAMLVGLAIAVFFFGLMLGPADPFAATVGSIPADGAGPNSLLQDNVLVAVHPVFLYLGFVGFTIPFSFAISTLITGRVGEGWLVETRRFAVFSFAFLTLGIMLGSWWSYQVLGWGGFWGWDPVENAAILPWITATAYLHSVMVQERRGLLRVWNLSLLIGTFALTILATFLTRSGLVLSVHSFSNSGVGPALLVLFGVVVFGSVILIGWRGDKLRSAGGIDAAISREGAFLLNNFLFGAFAVVVLAGTVFPLFVEAISGNVIQIGAPYFDTFTVPIGVALLFLMAIAPALPWRKGTPAVLGRRLVVPAWAAVATVACCVAAGVRGLTPLVAFGLGAFAASSAIRQLVLAGIAAYRRGDPIYRGLLGRANGGMVVHIGIVMIATGLAAAGSFASRDFVTLVPGQSVTVDGHVIRLISVQAFSQTARYGEEATLRIDGRATLRPAIDIFRGGSLQPVGTPAFTSSLIEDVYLAPNSLKTTPGHELATLQIVVQPLVSWLWIGGAVVAGGAVLAAMPGRRRRRPTDPSTILFPELLDELAEQGAGR
jgi:cytochrome c-type biogenesis protein CcmF